MKGLNRYYRQIRWWLPCGGRLKRQLMDSITATIEAYIDENPFSDIVDLQNHFGSPQQIAAAYVDEMDMQQLLKALLVRRKLLTVVIAVAAFIILLWTAVVTAAYLEVLPGIGSYNVVEII